MRQRLVSNEALKYIVSGDLLKLLELALNDKPITEGHETQSIDGYNSKSIVRNSLLFVIILHFTFSIIVGNSLTLVVYELNLVQFSIRGWNLKWIRTQRRHT